MKKLVKICALVLALSMAFPAAACRRGREGGIEIDPTKTQLYVSFYEGGYGEEWLTKLSARFEEYYKDVCFEPGVMVNGVEKKGVQIVPEGSKDSGLALAPKILASRSEVFFTERLYYYDYIAQGLVADITDIVTESLEEYGDTGTIEQKLDARQQAYYKTEDRKYYGLPHYLTFAGITYDVDLFDQEGLYFAADPDNANDGFIINKTDRRSAGPDGEFCEVCAANGYNYSEHNCDDGLPVTYDDFFKLCDYIVEGGMLPIVWSGQSHQDYLQWLLQAFAADYEGLDKMMLNFTFNGSTDNILSDVSSDGTVTRKPAVTIENANGYELYASAGRYYALKFLEGLVSDSSYYHNKAFNTTHSHLDAQMDFLASRPEPDKNAAMLFDGIWWENEANDSFESLASRYGEQYSRANRRLGFMPYPKAEGAAEGSTIVDTQYATCFIRGNLTGNKLDLAKKFVKFANTNASLVEFTMTTNTPKALNYTMTESERESMTYFGRSVLSIKEKSDIVYPYSTNSMYLANQSSFDFAYSFESNINGTVYNDPAMMLRPSTPNSKTAEEYFKGITDRYAPTWARDYAQWI